MKGSLVLALGEGLGYGASFLRNMLLARLLTKVDFGVAASFSLVISLLDMAGKMAISQLVVQDRDGDQPHFLATAQFIQFTAGAGSALVIVFAAAPLASLLGVEDRAWAIRWLALIPLCRGLENLDIRRMARDLRFLPSTIVEVVPQVMITLAAWPLVVWLGDYRAVLVLLIVKMILSLAASHLLAERNYRWRMDRRYIARVFSFGWPLVLNSMLMFGVLQGDQVLVGTNYSMADLAVYAAAASLTLVPGNMFISVMSSIMLPMLAKVQDDQETFIVRYRVIAQFVSAFSVFYTFVLVVGSEAIITLVFGMKYAGGGIVFSWLAAANSLRLLRVAPAMAALAKADTKNQLFTNLLRATALAPAIIVSVLKQPIWVVAAVGLSGESLAFVYTLYRLYRRDGIPLGNTLRPAFVCWIGLALAGALAMAGSYHWLPAVSIGVGLLAGTLCSLFLLHRSSEAWEQAIQLLGSFRHRLHGWSFGSRSA
jgi:O-antigen/teichoic acid export membrane protein